MKQLFLCGAGNAEGIRLALQINAVRQRWQRIVVLDDDPAKHGKTILGLRVAGSFSTLRHAHPDSSEVVNLVARTTAKRCTARAKIAEYGLPFAQLVHPSVITDGTSLADDLIVYQNSTIGPGGSVGEGSVLFMGSVTGHGCNVGPCCVVAPNAVLNARVQVGEGAYVGTSAAILPEIKIGAWSTVAAGSAVIRDVPVGATVMGVPAKTVLTLDQKLKFRGPGALPQAVRRELEALAR